MFAPSPLGFSGRYEVEMFDDFLRMHGKTYDYKITFKSIKSLFLLPKPDDIHVVFVVGFQMDDGYLFDCLSEQKQRSAWTHTSGKDRPDTRFWYCSFYVMKISMSL